MSKTIAYIRASTSSQDVKNQRHEILEYGHREGIQVDEFIEATVSSRKSSRQRRIEELQETVCAGDLLINQLIATEVDVIVIKQNLCLGNGLQDVTSKVMVTLLALFAEIERDFISHRTKEALASKKAQGMVLGKPKGTIQSSMYDKDKERIGELLALGVPQKRIVESHLGYGTTKSLSYYIGTRKLRPKTAL